MATTTMVTAYRKNSTRPPWLRWYLRALQPSGDLGGWGRLGWVVAEGEVEGGG
jgi:hypothetical protein